MSKPKTYVTIILDQSQSMCGTKAQAVQGYNEHVQQMKINSKEQDIFCSLITFNGDVFEHLWMEPADKLTEASAEDYKTEGSTALRDAVGYAIEKLKKTVTDPEASHLVIIVSDGEENASRHYSNSALNELKDSVDKTGKWTFTYMGCDDKYLQKISRDMKIPLSNMAKWSNNTPELAMRGMKRTADKAGAYYSARAKGVVASSNLYCDDSGCVADFTVDEGTPVVDLKPSYVPDLNITMTVLNDAHQAMNVKNDGHEVSCYVSPFNNYKPVDWQG